MRLANGSGFGLNAAQLRMIRGIATSDDESTCERTMDWVDGEMMKSVIESAFRRKVPDGESLRLSIYHC